MGAPIRWESAALVSERLLRQQSLRRSVDSNERRFGGARGHARLPRRRALEASDFLDAFRRAESAVEWRRGPDVASNVVRLREYHQPLS